MNIQSVAIVSGTEADPAETVVKAAVSAEATEDGSLAVKTGTAEDSGRGDRDRRDDDNTVSGENRRHRRDENREDGRNGAAATKRQRTVNTRGQSGERSKRERSGKSRASATASPRKKKS